VVRIWGLSLDWVHQNLFVSSVPKPRLSFIDGKQDGTQPGSSYTGVLPIRWTRTLPFLESCKIRGYATVDLCSPSLDPSFSGISVSAVCTKVRSQAWMQMGIVSCFLGGLYYLYPYNATSPTSSLLDRAN
jgi:hypothetical protein